MDKKVRKIERQLLKERGAIDEEEEKEAKRVHQKRKEHESNLKRRAQEILNSDANIEDISTKFTATNNMIKLQESEWTEKVVGLVTHQEWKTKQQQQQQELDERLAAEELQKKPLVSVAVEPQPKKLKAAETSKLSFSFEDDDHNDDEQEGA